MLNMLLVQKYKFQKLYSSGHIVITKKIDKTKMMRDAAIKVEKKNIR